MVRKKKNEKNGQDPQLAKEDETADKTTNEEKEQIVPPANEEEDPPKTTDDGDPETVPYPLPQTPVPKGLYAEVTREHIESDHAIRLRRDEKEFIEAEVWNNANGGIFVGALTVEQILTGNGFAFREDSKTIARIYFSPHTGEISHIEQVNN